MLSLLCVSVYYFFPKMKTVLCVCLLVLCLTFVYAKPEPKEPKTVETQLPRVVATLQTSVVPQTYVRVVPRCFLQHEISYGVYVVFGDQSQILDCS